MVQYSQPIETYRVSTEVVNSAFICTIGRADSTAVAHGFVAQVRREMSDASHHVYAFRVGYGNSITEGMSDDNEPSGTAGPPVLAVLRGTLIGNVVVVITRYFGGIKLGTGGLVRAYTQAAQLGIAGLKTELVIAKSVIGIDLPYPLYERALRLIQSHDGRIEDETFTSNVSIILQIPQANLAAFQNDLNELMLGRATIIMLGES